MSTDVAVIVGSLRKEAYSRRVAKAMIELAPAPLACEIVEIGDLPLYNQDLETDTPPAAWSAFRERIHRAQALLFVTPEYNRSIPGGLKNAIDVGSRPYGKSMWGGKPAAIVSCSPGAIGAFGANHHLRQPMVFLDVPMLQREAYLSGVDKLFEESGALVPRTHEFLDKYMHAFAQWVARILA
ncbi:MAG: NAD(P)H-dependent oxidoreductase [Gammaproteobacteria bacterium]|nr:MAG: NAD(P)H-dependent oxidoreductase [Gammaproteobacteria bacterium]